MDKYKTLSTVFDGVPKPWPDSLKNDSLKKPKRTLKKVESADMDGKTIYFHKPYEKRECVACHAKGNSLGLIDKVPNLCYRCHQDFHEKYDILHGPLELGTCLNCHNAHQSEHKILLTRNGNDICMFCHEKAEIDRNIIHNDIADKLCWSCHNPHGGKDRRFIK